MATLLAVLALAACGGSASGRPAGAVERASTICRNAAVPGIPVRIGPKIEARLAQLALGQERREVAALRALQWDELDRALEETFEPALRHLAAFVRTNARRAVRVSYDALLARWQARAADLGPDDCTRFGLAF